MNHMRNDLIPLEIPSKSPPVDVPLTLTPPLKVRYTAAVVLSLICAAVQALPVPASIELLPPTKRITGGIEIPNIVLGLGVRSSKSDEVAQALDGKITKGQPDPNPDPDGPVRSSVIFLF